MTGGSEGNESLKYDGDSQDYEQETSIKLRNKLKSKMKKDS